MRKRYRPFALSWCIWIATSTGCSANSAASQVEDNKLAGARSTRQFPAVGRILLDRSLCLGTVVSMDDSATTKGEKQSFCGWIVTAAHCATPPNSDFVLSQRWHTSETLVARLTAADWVVHPHYRPRSYLSVPNDIAMGRVCFPKAPEKVFVNFRPIPLTSTVLSPEDNGHFLTFAGFFVDKKPGAPKPTTRSTPEAISVSIPISYVWPEYFYYLATQPRLFRGLRNTELGDSGGPALWVPDGETSWQVVGVTSQGDADGVHDGINVRTDPGGFGPWAESVMQGQAFDSRFEGQCRGTRIKRGPGRISEFRDCIESARSQCNTGPSTKFRSIEEYNQALTAHVHCLKASQRSCFPADCVPEQTFQCIENPKPDVDCSKCFKALGVKRNTTECQHGDGRCDRSCLADTDCRFMPPYCNEPIFGEPWLEPL